MQRIVDGMLRFRVAHLAKTATTQMLMSSAVNSATALSMLKYAIASRFRAFRVVSIFLHKGTTALCCSHVKKMVHPSTLLRVGALQHALMSTDRLHAPNLAYASFQRINEIHQHTAEQSSTFTQGQTPHQTLGPPGVHERGVQVEVGGHDPSAHDRDRHLQRRARQPRHQQPCADTPPQRLIRMHMKPAPPNLLIPQQHHCPPPLFCFSSAAHYSFHKKLRHQTYKSHKVLCSYRPLIVLQVAQKRVPNKQARTIAVRECACIHA